jgi:hypothetical protein
MKPQAAVLALWESEIAVSTRLFRTQINVTHNELSQIRGGKCKIKSTIIR